MTNAKKYEDVTQKPWHQNGITVEDTGDGLGILADVIAIHGVHGSSRGSWWSDSLNQLFLPQLILGSGDDEASSSGSDSGSSLDSSLQPTIRSILYGYDSSQESGTCYSISGIFAEAELLLNALIALRTPGISKKKRPIYFISHDLGGCIVKALFVLARRNMEQYADVLNFAQDLIFYGYPHRPSSKSDLEEQIYALLSLQSYRFLPGEIARRIFTVTEAVTYVNDTFLNVEVLSRVVFVNIYSARYNPSQRVFSREAALFDSPWGREVCSTKTHAEMLGSHMVTWKVRPPSAIVDISSLHHVRYLASPLFPCYDDKSFLKDIPELKRMAETSSNQILHIRCNSDAHIVSKAVELYLRMSYNTLGFIFNEHDIRFSSIRRMLVSLLVYQPSTPNRRLYSLTSQDLYVLWLFGNMHKNSRACQFINILGCLDNCDESSLWFLHQLQSYVTRFTSGLKIVIVTTEGSNQGRKISTVLDDFPEGVVTTINISVPPPQRARFQHEAALSLHENHGLHSIYMDHDVKTLIKNWEMDKSLCALLNNCLRMHQTPSKLISRFLLLPKTPDLNRIFETILEDVPEDRRIWAQTLLSWVVSSLRPLRTSEFCYISDECLTLTGATDKALCRDEGEQHAYTMDILRYFGGLLISTFDEIRFGHASIRSWLTNSKTDPSLPQPTSSWQNSEHFHHTKALNTCLSYLRDDTSVADVWASQLPYALEFWTIHYKKSGSPPGVLDFIFDHQPVLNRWIDAYRALPGLFVYPSKKSNHPLPIAAHFGLDHLVKSLIAKYQDDSAFRQQALAEAATGCQVDVFHYLLQVCFPDFAFEDRDFQDAVLAAAYCETPSLLEELVDYIPPSPHSIPKRSLIDTPVMHKASDDATFTDVDKCGDDEQDPQRELEQGGALGEGLQKEPEDYSRWLNDVLCRASWLGMTEVMKTLLCLGADPNLPDRITFIGEPPLFIAGRHDQPEMARILIEAGAAVNGSSTGGAIPLYSAVFFGSIETIGVLLDNEANIEWIDDANGLTLLQFACKWGRLEEVKALLAKRDFREYIPEKSRDHPLLVATRQNHYKVVEALLHHGVDPNFSDDQGNTPLYYAATAPDTCRLLLEHNAEINPPDSSYPALLRSIWLQEVGSVRLLVEHGADVELVEPGDDAWNRTPLHIAVTVRNLEIVRYLLDRGANPNVYDTDGDSPLSIAARDGQYKIVQILLEHQADIESPYTTALHLASNHKECVRILLKFGGDINRADKFGHTPLEVAAIHNSAATIKIMIEESQGKLDFDNAHIARALCNRVRSGSPDVVALFLEAGADVNTVHAGHSLLEHCLLEGDVEMTRTILEYGPELNNTNSNGDSPLHSISSRTPVASVRLIVNAGGKLDSTNNQNKTPFIVAIGSRNEAIANYFLTKEAIVRHLKLIPTEFHLSPLHVACLNGPSEIVNALLNHGLDVNLHLPGLYGTPLVASCQAYETKDETEKIVKLLLERGANPHAATDIKGPPILAAIHNCWPSTVQLLLGEKVSLEVKDYIGRRPLHFACCNSLDVLALLNFTDEEFGARDFLGSVPLHYAALSGQLDLVREVLSRSEAGGMSIDVQDNDGWTPLMWASRAVGTWRWQEQQSCQYSDVVTFFLDRGAGIEVSGRALDREWTALEVARYHRAPGIAELLVTSNVSKTFRKEAHPRPVAVGGYAGDSYCDCCHSMIRGRYFNCTVCVVPYSLCFKCYGSKTTLHPQHEFSADGYEIDGDSESLVSSKGPSARPGSAHSVLDLDDEIEVQFDDEIVGGDD